MMSKGLPKQLFGHTKLKHSQKERFYFPKAFCVMLVNGMQKNFGYSFAGVFYQEVASQNEEAAALLMHRASNCGLWYALKCS